MTDGAESLKNIVKGVLAAYAQGDVAPLRAAIDPGIVYVLHAPKEVFRMGGRHEGYASAIAAMSSIATDFTVHSYDGLEMLSDGETVWFTVDMSLTDRKSSKTYTIPMASRWKFRGGKVVLGEQFFDSASVALWTGRVAIK